ncbi:MAG TPA: cytochrome c peroxidase [Chitinophagaceae bacterium]|nr:cytochrome c peroxidase [Chitinophagaceae bacterium]
MKKICIISAVLFIAFGAMLAESCRKSGDKAPPTTPLTFSVPQGFPQPVFDFNASPVTKEGFELGRRLFYEGKLSKDGNFPCASCHQQFAAFATYDHDLSHGFNNQFTTRNAPGLFNLAWHSSFQWDGGVNHLEVQPLAPITAPNEMAEDINNVIEKLKQDPQYPGMFRAAFGTGEINSQRMLKALSQFMIMMVSGNSKYDKMKRGQATFNSAEQAGYLTFQAKCASCHVEPMFSDFSFRNNGLTVNQYLKDYGRMRITNKSSDSLKFKVPSLRNIYETYPYMHDGRFWNLSQVLEHYSTGIQNSATLDPLLKNKIPLTATEKFNLIYFLGTLSDTSFTKDKRFEQPQ